MTDEMVEGTPRTHSGSLLAAIAVAMLLGLGGIIWSYSLSNKLVTQQQALTDSAAQNTKLSAALQDTDARLNAATGANLGGTPSLGPLAERLKTVAPCSYPESFDRSVMAFVEALQQGRPAPVTGADGLAAMRLEAAVAESARTGRAVVLESA